MLKDDTTGPVEHCDRFYYWLKSVNVPGGHRAGTVRAIAEKMNVTYGGIYSPDEYGDLEEDKDKEK